MQIVSPGWFAFILYFVTSLIFFPGRKVLERVAYNHSLSGKYGDLALSLALMIPAQILQQQAPRGWLADPSLHMVVLVILLVIGLILWNEDLANRTKKSRTTPFMEQYHNVFVVPLFLYLLLFGFVLSLHQGTSPELALFFAYLVIWFGLFLFDASDGRLDQQQYRRRYFEEHGEYPHGVWALLF
jgi:hypothetical protein